MAVAMDASSNQFLARAALPGHHHRCFACGHLTDFFQHLLHAFPAAHDSLGVIRGIQDPLVGFARSRRVSSSLQGLLYQFGQLLLVKGLQDVVERPVLHRLDCRLRRAVGSHQDYHGLRCGGTQVLQGLYARNGVHSVIQENDFRTFRLGLLDAGLSAVGSLHPEPRVPQHAIQRVANLGIVVYDEYGWIFLRHCIPETNFNQLSAKETNFFRKEQMYIEAHLGQTLSLDSPPRLFYFSGIFWARVAQLVRAEES